jgi:type I restriction enzyme, S subunit
MVKTINKPQAIATGDWSLESLGRLGRWLSGGTPSMTDSTYWRGSIPWVSPKDMKVSRLFDATDHITERALGNGSRLAPKHSIWSFAG